MGRQEKGKANGEEKGRRRKRTRKLEVIKRADRRSKLQHRRIRLPRVQDPLVQVDLDVVGLLNPCDEGLPVEVLKTGEAVWLGFLEAVGRETSVNRSEKRGRKRGGPDGVGVEVAEEVGDDILTELFLVQPIECSGNEGGLQAGRSMILKRRRRRSETHHGKRVLLQDRLLVFPLVGNAKRDGEMLLRDQQRHTSRTLERPLVEHDGDLACTERVQHSASSRNEEEEK